VQVFLRLAAGLLNTQAPRSEALRRFHPKAGGISFAAAGQQPTLAAMNGTG